MRRPFRLGRPERDIDDELAFHLAERERALVAAGEDPAAARARALDRFGDVSTVRGQCLTIDRDRARTLHWTAIASNVGQDVTYALRTFRHQLPFTIVVLLILAIGIGANTAIFTLIDALMLRPLPVANAAQLVTIGDPRRTGGLSIGAPRTDVGSYPLYVDLRDQTHRVAGLYASGRSERLDVRLAQGGDLTHPRSRFVSGNFFSVLGVPAFMGRTFARDEDHVPGGSPVLVVSYRYWQRALAGDPNAVGRVISVNGLPLTVIGVTPRSFAGDVVGQATDAWIPITMQPSLMPQSPHLADRNINWLLLMGRLAPGATVAQARAELSALWSRSILTHASAADIGLVERTIREQPVRVDDGARGFSYYRAAYGRALTTLMIAVGLVLLVVCANVANLLLARAVARTREISVRIAIGAGRWRLVQQLVTESMLLALLGAALGLGLAIAGSKALLALAGGVELTVGLDGRVLAFAALLSLGTALLFGVLPAVRGTRLSVAAALRTQGRGGAAPTLALGRYLVVAQVAISMLLVVGAGMLARSTIRLSNADVGVARDKLVIIDLDATRAGFSSARLAAFMRDLSGRIQQVPGVAAVSLSENGIFSGTESGTAVQVDGFIARTDTDTLVAEDLVGAGYFHAVGAHLLRGRDFEPQDNETGAKVAVVNAAFASYFFPGGDAIGHHVEADSTSRTIVGVVADIHEKAVREDPVRRLYGSVYQLPPLPTRFRLEVRATGDPERLVVPLRQALSGADPSLAVLGVDPLQDLVRDSINGDRFLAAMVSVFGGLALVLAALGLYGVMAYATVRRTAEFGVRIALGAAPGAVGRMVLAEAIRMTGVGVVLGLPAALVSARMIRAQLFGIGFLDPPSIGFATVVLALSAALAAYLPATRAMRVAPMQAIHAD